MKPVRFLPQVIEMLRIPPINFRQETEFSQWALRVHFSSGAGATPIEIGV